MIQKTDEDKNYLEYEKYIFNYLKEHPKSSLETIRSSVEPVLKINAIKILGVLNRLTKKQYISIDPVPLNINDNMGNLYFTIKKEFKM